MLYYMKLHDLLGILIAHSLLLGKLEQTTSLMRLERGIFNGSRLEGKEIYSLVMKHDGGT